MGENSTGVDDHGVAPLEEEARIYCRQSATVHYQRQMRTIAASKSTVSEGNSIHRRQFYIRNTNGSNLSARISSETVDFDAAIALIWR